MDVEEMKARVIDLEAAERHAAILIARLRHALRKADEFITNGVELGYIKMPDADTPDPAHKTPSIIRAALKQEAAQ